MKRVMRWNDFGLGREAFLDSYRDMRCAVLSVASHVDSQRTRVFLRYGFFVLFILFSSAGIAHIAGWNPASDGNTSGDAGEVQVPGALPAVKVKCAECGVIVSMREIELSNDSTGSDITGKAAAGGLDSTQAKSTKSHELTIRLADGSIRVISEANSAKWRIGERVVVIGGAYPSNP
ncbi:MAG: hypothetical protein Q8L40_07400 [Burkholderiales bacterium]|nr:hypothetical protein [Burkholderiales bacterium]